MCDSSGNSNSCHRSSRRLKDQAYDPRVQLGFRDYRRQLGHYPRNSQRNQLALTSLFSNPIKAVLLISTISQCAQPFPQLFSIPLPRLIIFCANAAALDPAALFCRPPLQLSCAERARPVNSPIKRRTNEAFSSRSWVPDRYWNRSCPISRGFHQ